MILRLAIAAGMISLGGCYEGIEHQPDAGTCASNDACACGEQCLAHVCIPAQPHPCVHGTDCTAPSVCTETRRQGHTCGTFECLPP